MSLWGTCDILHEEEENKPNLAVAHVHVREEVLWSHFQSIFRFNHQFMFNTVGSYEMTTAYVQMDRMKPFSITLTVMCWLCEQVLYLCPSLCLKYLNTGCKADRHLKIAGSLSTTNLTKSNSGVGGRGTGHHWMEGNSADQIADNSFQMPPISVAACKTQNECVFLHGTTKTWYVFWRYVHILHWNCSQHAKELTYNGNYSANTEKSSFLCLFRGRRAQHI